MDLDSLLVIGPDINSMNQKRIAESPRCKGHVKKANSHETKLGRPPLGSTLLRGVEKFKPYSDGRPRWRVRLSRKENKQRLHLGYFDNFFEACCVRKRAELKYG